MATTKLKFYRGLKARYDAASKHLDAIYFATDTKELLMNGVNYGGSGVTDVSFDKGSNKLIVTKSSGKTEYDLTELIKFQDIIARQPCHSFETGRSSGWDKGRDLEDKDAEPDFRGYSL